MKLHTRINFAAKDCGTIRGQKMKKHRLIRLDNGVQWADKWISGYLFNRRSVERIAKELKTEFEFESGGLYVAVENGRYHRICDITLL